MSPENRIENQRYTLNVSPRSPRSVSVGDQGVMVIGFILSVMLMSLRAYVGAWQSRKDGL